MSSGEWWRGSVTYQVYPRSFMDANGDGIGDLAGITSRLEHIADLGVDAVWLSPVSTSPMKDMGYDVSDYRDIDPVFGSLADFDRLVEKAHRLGLKLIIDQVLSHSSNQHPFFLESRSSRTNRYADWYVWSDPHHDGTPPNNWQAIFGGIAWDWEPRRQQYYFHNFLKEQPDFNFHNEEVQDYHLETLKFWLDRGVDGFRLDTVNFYFHDRLLRNNAADYRAKAGPVWNPYDMQYHLFSKNQPENLVFLGRMRDLLDSYDARTLVGEVGEHHHATEMMGQYTSGGRLHMAYAFEMMGDAFSAAHFRNTIEGFFEGAPEGWPMWAMSNHDVVRHVSRWASHAADTDSFARLCAALLLSLQGSICLYQGEELGQEESDLDYSELTDPQGLVFWPENKGRDGCRTPMAWEADAPHGGFSAAKPWLPVKPKQLSHAVDRQTGEQSVLALYRQMLALRRAETALRDGGTSFLDTLEPVLAFTRGDAVLCVFNLSNKPARFEGAPAATMLICQDAVPAGDALTLGPNGFFIGRRA